MECLEFRREAGADPGSLSADARAHRDACPACTEFLRQTLALDERILAALRVPVPAPPPRSGRAGGSVVSLIDRRRWLALAASIVGGVIVGSLLWVGSPRESLARELVEHIGHEPEAMQGGGGVVGPLQLEEVLGPNGIRLRAGVGAVTYARSCPFRGRKVPHLVVQTEHGPVTVMVLRGEPVERAMRFDEQGYAGTIVPAGAGSVAVIGTGRGDLDAVAARVVAAMQWVGD